MHDINFISFVFVISLLIATLAYRPILLTAKKHHILDNPEDRKLQRHPIPVMGGFVVFLGAIVGSLSYWFKYDCTAIIPVQIAMLLMLLVGTYDDIRKLSPLLRLIIEIIVVTALALYNNNPINDLHGLWNIHLISPYIAWPLTIIACVGVINAINMIDGIDGLVSGISIMAIGFYSWILFRAHDFVRAALGVSVIGALIPFFVMNVFGKRSKMFIGDAGTMMLGIVFSDFLMTILTHDSLCAQRFEPEGFSLVAFALAVLAIPVFDTIRVMLSRIILRKSPFSPDRSHLHHAFVDYGFHHLEASLMEIILNALIILFFFIVEHSYLSINHQLYAVIAASLAITLGLY